MNGRNIMDNRYVIPHQSWIDLDDIHANMVRLRAECSDPHARALASNSIEMIMKIRKQIEGIVYQDDPEVSLPIGEVTYVLSE